jgi:4-hydroxybenzoate polyprenyltransferase
MFRQRFPTLLNRYRRLQAAWATSRMGRAWRENVRPVVRLRSLRDRLRDLAYLLRLERAAYFNQFVLGYAVTTPGWSQEGLLLVGLSVACLGPCLYGGLYALNDVADVAADRQHPAKRQRPVASGRIPLRRAKAIGIGLVLLGLLWAHTLDERIFLVALALVAVNGLYTHLFKHIRWLDLLFNTLTHPLRLAGGMWLGGGAPHWGLLVGCLAAALANSACKRLNDPHAAPLGYTRRQLLVVAAVCHGFSLGLLPFLPDLDLVLAAPVLALAIVVVLGQHLSFVQRLMRLLGR